MREPILIKFSYVSTLWSYLEILFVYKSQFCVAVVKNNNKFSILNILIKHCSSETFKDANKSYWSPSAIPTSLNLSET